MIATGLARGAAMRGKRIAFGDGRTIKWDTKSAAIFARNPNIAPIGSELAKDLEWVAYYKGHRIYNRQDGRRWLWSSDFHVRRGEVFFRLRERTEAIPYGAGYIVIEPNVARAKPGAMNKDWGFARYQTVANTLAALGHRVMQFDYGAPMLEGVERVRTAEFRTALAILSNAMLYIGPEGGLHHGAAAVGVPAVVIFGGWVPPAVTGYSGHVNLTGGAEDACGLFDACRHCRAALDRISPDEVLDATSFARSA